MVHSTGYGVFKPPQEILPNLYRFSPNRETLGGTAYFIREPQRNLLIDCPPWQPETATLLTELGGVQGVFLTHRTNCSPQIQQLQSTFDCPILVQEQEAYRLPTLSLKAFAEEISWGRGLGIWTPGHSPGSACWYCPAHGGILFTGRHLLADAAGNLALLRQGKTFHWLRQVRSAAKLQARFSDANLQYLCPGANVNYLPDAGYLAIAGAKLQALDLDLLAQIAAL